MVGLALLTHSPSLYNAVPNATFTNFNENDPARLGDQTLPNPTATALIRAGALDGRATYFRNDIARAANSSFPKNPHTFLTNLSSGPGPAAAALGAQGQIASFFSSNGAVTVDPDGPGPLFETPIAGPLPEELNFIP